MSTTNKEQLLKLLKAAEALTGPPGGSERSQAKDVAQVLERRLEAACAILSDDFNVLSSDKLVLQKATANYVLCLLERMQSLLDVGPGAGATAPLLGTRDLGLIRTLVSIMFRWGVDQQLLQHWKGELNDATRGSPQIPQSMEIDSPSDRRGLNKVVVRIYGLVFREDLPITDPSSSGGNASRTIRQTHITQVLLTRHATDMLRPTIYLGWQDTSRPMGAQMTTYTTRLLNLLPAAQTIASLGTIMSPPPSFPLPPAVLLRGCSNLLTQQLLRPDGVIGLFSAMFGDDDCQDEAPLDRLEHISQILSTPPKVLSKAVYFRTIIPRLIPLLLTDGNKDASEPQMKSIPRTFVRGAAFTLARLLTRPSTAPAASNLILPCLHSSLLTVIPLETSACIDPESILPLKSPYVSVKFLTTFLLNTDPSPALISSLITPILAPLYYLTEFFDTNPGVVSKNPEMKEMSQGLIRTWGRVVGALEARNGWWDIIAGVGGWSSLAAPKFGNILFGQNQAWNEWAVIEGELVVTQQKGSSALPAISKLVGKASTSGPLEMRPNPVRLVNLLKSLDRNEVSGAIFIRTLDEYSALRQSTPIGSRGDYSVRTMLYLSIVLEMIQRLGPSVMSQTQHILGFISHALEPAAMDSMSRAGRGITNLKAESSSTNVNLTLEDLKIIQDESDFSDTDVQGDSDDESDGGIGGSNSLVKGDDDEMTFTAINLLLSILEAHPDLTPQSSPILLVIFQNLESLADHLSPSIRKPALEARLVITTRSAIVPPPTPSSTTGSYRASAEGDESLPENELALSAAKEKARIDQQTIYQEALRLIQDPILPVRAHGLTILRQLVVSPPSSPANAKSATTALALNEALVPAVLSIFIEAAQDDDSFIFLNAVQGLAAMGSMPGGIGWEIIKRLVGAYAGGIKGSGEMSKNEMDKRLRVGEALEQVIRRSSGALGGSPETIIPPLITLFRSIYVPTTLRASALSLLALCADVAPDAILLWSGELTSGIVDLLQVESVPAPLKTSDPTPLKPPPISKRSEAPVSPTKKGQSSGKSSASAQRHAYEDSVPPLSKSTKAPSFRRAALHFLALFMRARLSQAYGATGDRARYHGASSGQGIALGSLSLPGGGMKTRLGPGRSVDVLGSGQNQIGGEGEEGFQRLGTVLRYVRMTDEDGMVRMQAGECVDLLEDLARSHLGI